MKTRQLVRTLVLIALIGALAQTALAQPVRPETTSVFSTSQRLEWNVDLVGQIGGWIRSVAVQGSTTYVGVGPRLFVFDTSIRSSPALLYQSEVLPSTVDGLAVVDDYVYVVGTDLHIMDVSNRMSPVEVGTLEAVHGVDIVVQGDTAYIASIEDGLRMVDVSDRTAPADLGSGGTSGEARGVAVSGGYAYVITDRGDLYVFDLTVPEPPAQVAVLGGLGLSAKVDVSGSYVYVAALMDGLHIIDVSVPDAPELVSTLVDRASPATDVTVIGDRAYLSLLWNDLSIVDVSNPAAPTATLYGPSLRSAHGLVVDQDYAYVVGGGGLRVWHLSSTSATVSGGYEMPGGDVTLSVEGDAAYIGGGMLGGFYVIDASAPASPTSTGVYDNVQSVPAAHAVVGDTAYLAEEGALRVLDLAAATPVEAGYLGGLGDGQDVVVSNGRAYIAETPHCDWNGSTCTDIGGGLRIVDVDSLSQVGYTDDPTAARGVAVAGSYAYLAAGQAGLSIVDLSDPALMTVVGSLDTGDARAVAVSGNLAYVADAENGLVILDVGTPSAPALVGKLPYSGMSVYDVALEGTKAYIATNWWPYVVDVSDPTAPALLGGYQIADSRQVAAANGLIYVVAQGGGLFVLHYAPPALQSSVDIDPDSLNLKSKGKWVTAYVELPEGYDPTEIDVATVQLEVIAAEAWPTSVGDADEDATPDRMVKFDRQALIDYLDGTSGEVTLTVSGQLIDGAPFEGQDTISVH